MIPSVRGDLGIEHRSLNMQLQISAATWRIETRSASAFSQITLNLLTVGVIALIAPSNSALMA